MFRQDVSIVTRRMAYPWQSSSQFPTRGARACIFEISCLAFKVVLDLSLVVRKAGSA